MNSFTRPVAVALTAIVMAGATAPLAAETVADCYEKVLNMCADALDAARWYEKPIIGAMCSAMLAGCVTKVNISVANK